ncbi:MAG: hypothetical protein ABI743_00085 [bacterium]
MRTLHSWPILAVACLSIWMGTTPAVWADDSEDQEFTYEDIGTVTVADGRTLGVSVGRTTDEGILYETVVLVLPAFDEGKDNVVSVLLPEEADTFSLIGMFASMDMTFNDLEARARPIRYEIEASPEDGTGLKMTVAVDPESGSDVKLQFYGGKGNAYKAALDTENFSSFLTLLDAASESISPSEDEADTADTAEMDDSADEG